MIRDRFLLAALVLGGCGSTAAPEETGDTDEPSTSSCPRAMPALGDPAAREAHAEDAAVAALAAGVDDLSAALLAELDAPEVNGAFSAFSVVGMFSVLLPGADEALEESLVDVLRIPQDPDAHHEALSGLLHELDDVDRGWGFEWGAGFWHRPSLTVDPDWADAAGTLYDLEPTPLDFQADGAAAREVLNGWVEEHTRCLIPEFYPENYDFSRTVHVAIHAMALEALWETPFDGAFTQDRAFHRADGSTVSVPTMSSQEFRGSTGALDDDTVLRLPYKGDDLAMYLVVPDEPTDPRERLASVDHDQIGAWADAVEPEGTIALRLPKWTSQSTHDLIPPLEALGYGPLVGTAMPGLCDGCFAPDVVRQVVVVQVDEEGTRAAAATSGETNDSEPEWVTVDRPFLWFLRDDASGVVLWTGWVGDPSAP